MSGNLVCLVFLFTPVLACSPVTYNHNVLSTIFIQESSLGGISGPLVGVPAEIWKVANKHGVDYNLMYDLALCESTLRHEDCWGDYSTSTNSYLAYGIYQWHQDSWDDHNMWLELNLDRTKLIDQIEMTALVLKNGGQHNWLNCWRKIKK